MSSDRHSPRAVIYYAPEDDWLARAIYESIEEKEFYIQLQAQPVDNSDELWQKLNEDNEDSAHFLVLLTSLSFKKLWAEQKMSEEQVLEMSKEGRFIPILHNLPSDDFPAEEIPHIFSNIPVYMVSEMFDVDSLVQHIQSLNKEPPKPPEKPNLPHAPDSFNKPDGVETDARPIVDSIVFHPKFQVDVTRVKKHSNLDDNRLKAALSWLVTRGLVKVEEGRIIGNRPSIDCFNNIIAINTLREGIAGRCTFGKTDTLLLKREKFIGRIFNEKGSFNVSLTAYADRSGRIQLGVDPIDRASFKEQELIFAYGKWLELECESVNDSNRKLSAHNLLMRCDINKTPMPMWFETDKVVITDECVNTDKMTQITFCLSEFDCPSNVSWGVAKGVMYDPSGDSDKKSNVMMPPPKIEGLGYLTLFETLENSIKNRSNQRITTTLSIISQSESETLTVWRKKAGKFMTRLISVLEFMQGGMLFLPITELRSNGRIETTFLCHSKSSSQFMPVILGSVEFQCLIDKVIEKQNLDEGEWDGLIEAISFALSAHSCSEVRMLGNLIAIEKLVKLFGEERRKKCKLGCKIEFFMNDRNISSTDIDNEGIKKLVDNRNNLAHNGNFSGEKEEFPDIFALSHELLTRIILGILGFSGWYCSYTCEKGVRDFPDCQVINEHSLPYFSSLRQWKITTDQMTSRERVYLPD